MATQTSYAETQPRLSYEHRAQLLAHLLRLPELFSQAQSVLKPEQFCEADEPHLRILWKVATKVVNANGQPALFASPGVGWHTLSAECQAYLGAFRGEMPPECDDYLFNPERGLLAYAFQMSEGELRVEYGRELLARFLDERWVQDPVRRALQDAGEQAITNLPLLLRETEDRRAVVTSLFSGMGEEVIPEGWEPAPLVKTPTNVAFVDSMLNGGDCPGETYGVLGAFKAGKTTLGIQLMVGAAEYELLLAQQEGLNYKPHYAHLFHYEAGSDEMRKRLIVNAAGIHRDTVEAWHQCNLSRRGHLKPYEKALFADDIKAKGLANVDGEFERYYQCRELLKRVVLHDMSGPKDNPKQGSRHIQEIAERLLLNVRAGRPPRRVLIDYFQLVVRRYINENGMRPDQAWGLMASFAYDCLRLIAIPFHCPVWILGQLSGQANKRTSATKQHHTEAAGTASFAENLWFSFQMGVPDDALKAMWFACGAARRADKGDPIIVRLDGGLGRIRKAEEVVFVGGRFRLKDTLSNYHTPAGGAPYGGFVPNVNQAPPSIDDDADPTGPGQGDD
jgi:hypothetical protein